MLGLFPDAVRDALFEALEVLADVPRCLHGRHCEVGIDRGTR